MVPMFQRFGGRLRMIMRRNVAIPVQADEILQEESDAPRSVVLPDNGDIRRRLEKIRGEIADEHLADAARHLGQLLQNSEIRDFFLSRDEDRRDGRSFQAEVRRLIETLPPEGRAAYRAQFEAVARQQLNAAILNGGESALREVTRRFPSTAAGSEALYRLGQFLWDHGRPEAAAACLERLRGAPDAAAIEPAVSILLAACRQRAGQGAQFRAAVEELRTREIPVKTQIAGRPLVELLHGERVAEVLGEMLGLMVTAPPADEVDWSVFRGDPARNRKVAAGAPLLAARWTHEIAGDPQTQLSLEHSSRAYREGRGTHVPLLHPLAVGDLILMRTTRGVAAFDLATGDRLWQHPTDDDANNAGVDRLLWREPAGGAFAADAECFYLL
jgi:hypothetical protein